MEKKTKTEYNREYMRERKGYKTTQQRNNIVETGERLTVIIPKDHKEKLKRLATNKQIGLNQLLRNIIADVLDKS